MPERSPAIGRPSQRQSEHGLAGNEVEVTAIVAAENRGCDLLWIREDFHRYTEPFGPIVVHGHTPHEAPEMLPNRINLDTGAFATNRLTCLVIDQTGAFLLPE